MILSTAQSHAADACDRGDDADTEPLESPTGSKRDHADHEGANDVLDCNDETPDVKAERCIQLRDDAIDKV